MKNMRNFGVFGTTWHGFMNPHSPQGSLIYEEKEAERLLEPCMGMIQGNNIFQIQNNSNSYELIETVTIYS